MADQINIIDIPGDGNCLFSSFIYAKNNLLVNEIQFFSSTFFQSVRTTRRNTVYTEMDKQIKDLRKNTIAHIRTKMEFDYDGEKLFSRMFNNAKDEFESYFIYTQKIQNSKKKILTTLDFVPTVMEDKDKEQRFVEEYFKYLSHNGVYCSEPILVAVADYLKMNVFLYHR